MGLWGVPKHRQDRAAGSQTHSWVWSELAPQHSGAVLPPKPCLSCCSTRLPAQTAFRTADWNLGFLLFFWNTNESIRQQGGGRSVGVQHLLLGNCAATLSWARGPAFVNMPCTQTSRNTKSSILWEIGIQNNYLAFQGNIQNTQKSSGTPLIAVYSLWKG